MKLFAELEIKRKEREAKEMHERYEQHCACAFRLFFPPHASSEKIRNHRILEKSKLEQTSGDHLVQPPWIRLTRALSSRLAVM